MNRERLESLVTNSNHGKSVVLDSFRLTPEELVEFKIVTGGFEHCDGEELEKLARTTRNAGLQHFLMGKDDLTLEVLGNHNLSVKVVNIFLGRVQALKAARKSFNSRYLLSELLKNKVVVADAKLFKRTWDIMSDADTGGTSNFLRASYDDSMLRDSLASHSASKAGQVNAMSVGTLLFVLSHLNKRDPETILYSLVELRAKIIENREAEIRAWVKTHMSGCEDLPLSWVYEVFDLYISDDKVVSSGKMGETL